MPEAGRSARTGAVWRRHCAFVGKGPVGFVRVQKPAFRAHRRAIGFERADEMKIGRKLRSLQDGKVVFNCPGCNSQYAITVHKNLGAQGPVWGYNNNPDAPTFTPSVLVTWKEPSDNPDEFDDETKDISHVCHSFVTDGCIQYLADCTHALAGQNVELPDMDDRT